VECCRHEERDRQADERLREVVGEIIAMKINEPSEKEYSTNPSSAYRTGFQEAVCMYRDRMRTLFKVELAAKHNIDITPNTPPDEYETITREQAMAAQKGNTYP
jgi:hypothetical protein